MIAFDLVWSSFGTSFLQWLQQVTPSTRLACERMLSFAIITRLRERMAMPQGKITSSAYGQEIALLISPVEEDHAILNALFQHNGWTLRGTSSSVQHLPC